VDLVRLLPTSGASGKLSITEFVATKSRISWTTWIAVGVVLLVCMYGGYRLREDWNNSHRVGNSLLIVLPFNSPEQDQKTSALIIGLTETLTAKLSEISGRDLQLISARDIREQGVTTTEQAWKEFGSDLVLEGSAHRVGDQIRIVC